jgi:hypothetical protein
VRRARGGAWRLAAVAAAGAIALAGCGGGGDGAAEAPGATTAAGPGATSGATATAPEAAAPTAAASQQLVDLVNDYAATLSRVQGGSLGPAQLKQSAARLRRGSAAVLAKADQVVAHACVERLARGQAELMGTVASFLQAAAEGDAEGATRYSEELKAADEAAMLRESKRCQEEVGYKGPQSG